MADRRVRIPATSVGLATVLGVGTAAATIVLAHPVSSYGIRAAAASAAAGLALAVGLTVLARGSSLDIASGGTLTFLGLLFLVLGAHSVWVDATPISVLTGGVAASSVVLLLLVAAGYADPVSLTAAHGQLLRWTGYLFLLGAGALAWATVPVAELVASANALLVLNVRTVAGSLPDAIASLLVHVVLLVLLVAVLTVQLRALELVPAETASEVGWSTAKFLAGAGALVLVPATIAASGSLMAAIADRSAHVAALVAWIADVIAQSPTLHSLLITLEALAVLALGVSLLLRLVRRARIEDAARHVGYATVAIVVAVAVAWGLGYVAATRQVDVLFELTGVRAARAPPGLAVGVGALLGCALVFGLTVALAALRFVLGPLYRFETRGVPAAATAGLFAGAALLGLTGTLPPVVAACLVGALLTWDVLENGVGLGEQLDGRFVAVPNEFAHAFASTAVGVFAAGLGLGLYALSGSVSPGDAPALLVVASLLAAGVVFALLLRRT